MELQSGRRLAWSPSSGIVEAAESHDEGRRLDGECDTLLCRGGDAVPI